jgi:hypothetical protein
LDTAEIARGYQVEADLERLIERRSRKGEVDPDEREEAWMESVRRHHAKIRERNRWEWVRYFDRMAENHAKLSEDYQRRAEKLCESNRSPRSPTEGEA